MAPCHWSQLSRRYLQSAHHKTANTVNKTVSFMRICNCCIFQQSAHIAYFPHKLAFSVAILILLVFLLPISITFHYPTIWLPTEWHHPCVQTPVERDGVVGFKQFCTIFPQISAAYLVFTWSAYFFKCHIKLTRLLCLANRILQNVGTTAQRYLSF